MNYYLKYTYKISHLIKLGFILLMVIAINSCDEFIEEDLSDQQVVLIAPSDSLVTEITTHTFWWEEIDGAIDYTLQIVSPDFDLIEKLMIDTTISTNKYMFQLYPGKYEWRVKASNASSETEFSTYRLEIDSTLNLSNASVIINSPANEHATQEMNVVFSWDEVINANEYKLQIKSGDWISGDLIESVLIETNSYSYTFSAEGDYSWGVRAENEISSSPYSYRSIIIDNTAPALPALTLPQMNAVLTNSTVTFEWTREDDAGSTIMDSIFVSTDSTFTSNLIVSTTSSNKSFIYTFSGSDEIKYFWRLSTSDAAENWSGYSSLGKFYIQHEK